MPTAAQFVAVAESQSGYTEYPPGSNQTKYCDWFGEGVGPWCDMFVSWCAAQIGAGEIVGRFMSCPKHADWFKARGQWHDGTDGAQPGDVVFFAAGGWPCHVGIVRGTDGPDLLTVEGNTSRTSDDNGGAVMLRRRAPGDPYGDWGILGYGRPEWGEDDMTEAQMHDLAEIVANYVNGYNDRLGSSLINEVANTKLRADSNGEKLDSLAETLEQIAETLDEINRKIL
jgi:hypothetical protein